MTLRKNLRIFLTVTASLLLVSCKDDFPAVEPKLVDLKKSRVLIHRLVDKKNLKFQAFKWVPIQQVDNGYCLTSKEIQSLLKWSRQHTQIIDE